MKDLNIKSLDIHCEGLWMGLGSLGSAHCMCDRRGMGWWGAGFIQVVLCLTSHRSGPGAGSP